MTSALQQLNCLLYQDIAHFSNRHKQISLPEAMGVSAVRATIGETAGDTKSAGDEPSGNRGLVMLPRLQSRKQPCWIGLDENWPCR